MLMWNNHISFKQCNLDYTSKDSNDFAACNCIHNTNTLQSYSIETQWIFGFSGKWIPLGIFFALEVLSFPGWMLSSSENQKKWQETNLFAMLKGTCMVAIGLHWGVCLGKMVGRMIYLSSLVLKSCQTWYRLIHINKHLFSQDISLPLS